MCIRDSRGTPVYLHDIATVEDSFKPRASITRLNGQDSVIINVRKQSGSNTVTVVEDIKKELEPILAMIPLVLGLSAGGEFRQSMSIAIMGGMITSTLLTLLIVPVAYVMVVGWQERWLARRATRRALREARRADEAADADGQDSIATQTGD